MNKKIKITIISLTILFLIGIVSAASFALMPKAVHKPSDYDLGITYEQAAKEDKPVIGVFYVDWCTYCQRFMPKLDKVRNINKNKINVVLINVDDPQNAKIAEDYRISGYPTVYIMDPLYDNRVHIDSAYLDSVTSLNKEVQRYLNFRKLIKKGELCK